MEENIKICQSCAMPMVQPEEFGTNENGSISEEYCIYYYKDGAFTSAMTMEQMIESNLTYLDEFNKESGQNFSTEEARAQLMQIFPTLKRWRK